MTAPEFLAHLRATLLLVTWIAAVVLLFWRDDRLLATTSVLLVMFILLALFICRRETWVIAVLISGLTAYLVWRDTDIARVVIGIERALLFAALLPTLQMARAMASRMPSVRRSRERLAAMPGHWGDIGILMGSQAFGAVMNTGTFSILSAVVPADASEARRRLAALASLRGMNIAIVWSPFFVGFAVIGTYVTEVPAWQVMGLGLAMVGLYLAIALLMFARPLGLAAIARAGRCLAPILPRMAIAAGAVVACGLLTPLSTLGSVLVVVPILMLVQFLRRPGLIRGVIGETASAMGGMGNDVVLVTSAMALGAVGEASPLVRELVLTIVGPEMPAPLLLAIILAVLFGFSIVGLHVIVTGGVLAAILGAMPTQLHSLVLYEGLLVGWSLGSMTSISSLSVVIAGAMYRTPPLRLAYGPNLLYALVVAIFAVIALSVLNWALTGVAW